MNNWPGNQAGKDHQEQGSDYRTFVRQPSPPSEGMLSSAAAVTAYEQRMRRFEAELEDPERWDGMS